MARFGEGTTPCSGFFTKDDLEQHCEPDRTAVALFGEVFDLSERLRCRGGGRGGRALRALAGSDATHLFSAKTRRPLRAHPLLELSTPGLSEAELALAGPSEAPWWADRQLVLGRLTARELSVRLINTLTFDSVDLRVPCEETLAEIMSRYLPFNRHAGSYTWKNAEGQCLDMQGTLCQNGLAEEAAPDAHLLIAEEDRVVPLIFLHFNDDLTEM